MRVKNVFLPICIGLIGICFALTVIIWRGGRPNVVSLSTNEYEGMECGHWAVLRTCELMGFDISPTDLLQALPANSKGHSLKSIADFLRETGLSAVGMKEDFKTFLAGKGVRIIHLSQPDHFIVVEKTTEKYVAFFDAKGRRQYLPLSRLKERWTGNVLHVAKPIEDCLLGYSNEAKSNVGPRAQFATLLIDRGDVRGWGDEGITDFVFPFVNLGASDLKISKVHTDCSCLKAIWPDGLIKRGEKASVILKYKSDRIKGAFVHEAFVESNDSLKPYIVLKATGNNDTGVSVQPKSFNFGEISKGERKRFYVFLKYGGDEVFEIVDFKSSISFVTVRPVSLLDIGVPSVSEDFIKMHPVYNKRVLGFEISVSPNGEFYGEVEGNLMFRSNVEEKNIVVPILAKIRNPAFVSPSVLLVKADHNDNDGFVSFKIVCPAKHDVVLKEVETVVGQVKLKFVLESQENGVLKFRLFLPGFAVKTAVEKGVDIRYSLEGVSYHDIVPVHFSKP